MNIIGKLLSGVGRLAGKVLSPVGAGATSLAKHALALALGKVEALACNAVHEIPLSSLMGSAIAYFVPMVCVLAKTQGIGAGLGSSCLCVLVVGVVNLAKLAIAQEKAA